VDVTPATYQRVRGDLDKLVHRGLDLHGLSRAANRVLARAVPFEGACLLAMDPATLLPTAEVVENGLPTAVMHRLTEIEMREPDYNKFTTLARGRQPAASLCFTTGGDLYRSRRHRELHRPNGFEDELRVVLSDGTGTWGALTLLREIGRPHFTPTDIRFVASLAGRLAEGLRRAALISTIGNPNGGDTGLLVLAADGTVEMSNTAAIGWLEELGVADPSITGLPPVIRAIAGRAQAIAADRNGLRPALARIGTRAGRWATVRGSLLGEGLDARVAVLIEAAQPPELAPLIADAYGLTDRERQVTELVAQGLTTSQISASLHLSPYTVQDHLKAIFDKSGTNTRGDLVARIFFGHYLPQLTTGTAPQRAPADTGSGEA
jgi:DNA-binding CsgD family transcriptional regulator